ncbi:MAG TPA: long-chain fatty acid--CoA ligase [Archaeoglobus profundus]|nr:long-chain fatty acid--CoA ligase [Archaeoglobus profundus]
MNMDTFPKLLIHNAQKFGDKISLREKDLGIWKTYTWKDYLKNVKLFSLGLISLGLEQGDKVAIIGDNSPEWLFAELATQSALAIPTGLYQDSLAEEVAELLDYLDARFVVAEDQEQVDKLLKVKEYVSIEKIIYWDYKGMYKYDDPILIRFDKVLELGEEMERKYPYLFEENALSTDKDDVACILTTSGTTAKPKGAMLTYENMISMAENLCKVDPIDSSFELISALPLAWVGEQMMSVSVALLKGAIVNFPESTETVREDMREIGPHVLFSPPRIWESIVSEILAKMEDANKFNKAIFNWAMKVGYEYADRKIGKKKIPITLKIKYKLAYWLVFRSILDKTGLKRIKYAYTGGAALGPDYFRFYHAIGVNLKQIYGQTEVAGIAVLHRDDDIKYHTVGKPIPGTEIKISEDGEILIRSRSVFKGYYKMEDKTREVIDEDGWLHTGDMGYIDEDGHLVVIDRLKDVLTLSDGTKFSPQYIENKLKFSPYIKEAVVIGHNRPYLTAIINIDMENVGKWAEKRMISYTSYMDLSQKDEVLELIKSIIKKVNNGLPKNARIKKFISLYKELHADDEELTRTRKVRRRIIQEKYKDLIDAMYSDSKTYEAKIKIRYEDGREKIIKTKIKIVEVN